MKLRKVLRTELLIVAGTAIVSLAAAWAAYVALSGRSASPQGSQETAWLIQEMKPFCVGRFVIDLPASAQVELSGARIGGLMVSAFIETDHAFQERIVRREAQLKSTPDRFGGNHNLESAREIGSKSGIAGKMFVHGRTVTEGTATNGLDVERYRYQSVAVEALVHVKGTSVDLAADDYFPDRISNLPRLVERITPVAEGGLPDEPGFCTGRANIADPVTADQDEEIMMMARFPSHPDIDIQLVLVAGANPAAQGLLERSADSRKRMPISVRWRFSELRAAARTINGLAGEELVTRVNEKNGAEVYGFWWEVSGSRDNVRHPHLMFRMDTGTSSHGPVPSLISEESALRLWDRIVSSIRVRHGKSSNNAVAQETFFPPE